MKFPKLILIKDLLAPVSISRNRMSEISSKIHTQDLDELDCHGLFVLAVSSLESMMNDVVVYLLQAVPEKLDFKECKLTKNELINSLFTSDIIIRQAQQEVTGAAYKNIEKYIEYFCKVTSIKHGFAQEKINTLREIRESRNLLLHNNLKINDKYKTKSGPNIRNTNSNDTLKIDIGYLQSTIECIQYFINEIENQIKQKYQKYSKVNLLKSTWENFFHSPVMKFEDYWHIDEKKDTVFAMKKYKCEGGLSSGETSLLNLWRSLSTGDSEHLRECWFQRLSTSYKEKALFLMMLSERNSLW